MARKKPKQNLIAFPETWGGRREGAGRKPQGRQAGVPHRPRADAAPRFPRLITVPFEKYLPSLRSKGAHRILWTVFRECCERDGFRLVHYSIQMDHLHLVVEVDDRVRPIGPCLRQPTFTSHVRARARGDARVGAASFSRQPSNQRPEE